ncbi:FecR domain-containing protein [Variovorax sp.]|uniref:FecR domain-containing protein n=1 Tax=Variovorax sp. TaxID=1871043 RepID=UPI00137D9A11|nr:FecR domain-containing protein [Variovorax sp.]KAF1057383.1 MAG: Protein FecR [Variovorax sp.]
MSSLPPSGIAEPPVSAEVARRAVEWMLELQGDAVPARVRDEWRRWRAAHPEHERAWRRIESVDAALGPLAAPGHAALALTALLFTGGGAWLAAEQTPWREWTADHRTGTGERRRIVLDDGTALVLNSGSAVDIRYGAAERRIRLIAGEVLVTSAKDAAARPLLVETAHGEAQALGTVFSVRRLPEASLLAVFEGAVALRPRQATGDTRVLQAGEATRFTATGVDAPHALETGSAAWTEGLIVARGMRLADFLAELSRHAAQPIRCDPAIAGLRISGTYPLADVDKVLDTLSATLSLEIQTVTRFWGLRATEVVLVPRSRTARAPQR